MNLVNILRKIQIHCDVLMLILQLDLIQIDTYARPINISQCTQC